MLGENLQTQIEMQLILQNAAMPYFRQSGLYEALVECMQLDVIREIVDGAFDSGFLEQTISFIDANTIDGQTWTTLIAEVNKPEIKTSFEDNLRASFVFNYYQKMKGLCEFLGEGYKAEAAERLRKKLKDADKEIQELMKKYSVIISGAMRETYMMQYQVRFKKPNRGGNTNRGFTVLN